MEKDILSLIIFAICIILFIWDKLPMATTAIMGCVAMVIAGVCDFKTAFGQFASSTVVLTISVMTIGAAISESGLADIIGRWIVKKSGGSEKKLIAGTYVVSAGMSMFLTNSAVLAVFIPIVSGLDRKDVGIHSKNLIMPIAIGCVIGGASTLVGSTQQMTAQGLLEEAGAKLFRTFDFTAVGAVMIAAGLIYCLTFGAYISKKLWGNDVPDIDLEELVEIKSEEKKNNSKACIAAVIFAVTVLFYITEWLPIAVTAASAALLCIISGCIDQKTAIRKINWNIIGRLGGCLGIAKALEAAGGTQFIADAVSKISGNSISPFILFCILVFAVQLISEFISNSTAIMIVLPVLLAIAPGLGLNSYTFALGITLASGVSLSCPLAGSTLGMSMVAGYKFRDFFKYNIYLDIVNYIIIISLVPALYGLLV